MENARTATGETTGSRDVKSVVAEWLKLDAELSELGAQMAARKRAKQLLSADLIGIMQSNGIDCFSVAKSQIVYSRTAVKKPITQKKLRELLAQYYSENTDEAEAVGTFICENRGTTLRETVTRKALASENPKGAGAPA